MLDYGQFLSRAGAAMEGSAIRKMGVMAARVHDMISFAPGYPDPKVFAWAEFRDIADSVLESRDANALQYGPTRGYHPLIESLPAVVEARGIRAVEDELLITTGSQQGLDLVARILCDPGDIVLVELPAYTGGITAFRDAQATIVGVRQQADGIDLEHLEAVVVKFRKQGRRVRFLYVVPNFQNPTGLLISVEKRGRLLELASRLNLLIVEDDPYGDLYFGQDEGHLTRPVKADDHEGRVLYLSSFSKTLAPGFRVAWIVGPAPLISKIEVAKQAADLCTGSLDQRIVHEALKRNLLAERVPELRAYYRHKKDVMQEAMREHLGALVEWQEPRGGFFLWAALPRELNAETMLTRAMAGKVIYVAGAPFYVDGTGSHFMRLSFSAPTPERIVEGVRRLAGVVREELASIPASRR